MLSRSAAQELEQLLGARDDGQSTPEHPQTVKGEEAAAKPKRTRKAEAGRGGGLKMRLVWDIIKSPVITEKALAAKEETQEQDSC